VTFEGGISQKFDLRLRIQKTWTNIGIGEWISMEAVRIFQSQYPHRRRFVVVSYWMWLGFSFR